MISAWEGYWESGGGGGWVPGENWKRNREGPEQKGETGWGGTERGWERGRKGSRRGRDPCLVHLPPLDRAVPISPALIASINNTAL